MSKTRFYETLYDSDDFIAIKNRKLLKDNEYIFIKSNASIQMMQNGMPAEYICINPVDVESDGSATNTNVFKYRNLLMEEDGGIPIEEQRAKIKESRLPYSTVVFSGNESAHFIISLEEPLKDDAEYRRWFRAIERVLSNYNYKADSACVNPSRLSRAAEGTNIKTGTTQDILEVRSRVSNENILEWLTSHNVHPDDFIPKDVEYTVMNGPDTANDDQRWEVVKKLMGKEFDYESLGDGEREPVRFQLAIKCKECRLSLSSATNYMINEFPSSKGSDKTRQDVQRVYDTREVEYRNIMSTEDWIKLQELNKKEDTHNAFDNLLDLEFGLTEVDEDISETEIDTDTDGELHRYLMIGNDIYFLANRRLYKRSQQTFTLHFPKRELLNVRRYTDFCNVPGYFNYQPIVNNHYNNFKMPKWKPRKGEWNTIEQYLNHISGSQFEMMLDYLQISLEHPKQKLPILLLMSYEKNTGKSTFFDLLSAIFGDNVEPVDPKQFEMEWNTQWCEKHFVFIDEMENIKDKEGVGTKLKKLAYFPTITKNKKGDDSESIEWNGRIVIASNQESGFIEIDDEEDRYWVLKVPRAQSYTEGYVELLKKEVPHFIYYLMNRKLSTKNENRGWFKKELLHTKALADIVVNSRPPVEHDVENLISEYFDNNKNASECNFILNDISLKIGNGYTDLELKTTIHKLYGVTAGSRTTKSDSFNGGGKKQKFWFTVSRGNVHTTEDMNASIEESFLELS